jgi:hypothetical protein
MSPHPKRNRARALTALLGLLTLVALTLSATSSTASSTAPSLEKLQLARPVIGKPTATPAQPLAGKRFVVSFKVTRSDNGKPVTKGRMICHPYVAKKVLRHSESFKRGKARLAFVVPANAAGKVLNVKVTIKAQGRSATRVARFRVQTAEIPTLSIGDRATVEGSSGTTALSFPVTLSGATPKTVSVSYATADGTATSPADYTAASGSITFKPGEKVKTISVDVVGDLAIEQDETFTVTISSPVNASIAKGTATGTITNDDTAVPVTPGSYKGATQNGNYVFFTVLPSRAITGFRINDLPCDCDPGGQLTGGENFGDSLFPIEADGTFDAEDDWSGSITQGSIEWTYVYVKITGAFATPTTVAGTVIVKYELNYQGTHFRCSSGEIRWSAALQG